MLTPDENEELARIHILAQFGELPTTTQQRYDELRSRNEALEIPEPTIDIQWLPQQPTRDDALDDRIGQYAEDAEQTSEPVVAEVKLPNSHTSLAEMAAFEAEMAGDVYYVASPHTGGFTPSNWYRAT